MRLENYEKYIIWKEDGIKFQQVQEHANQTNNEEKSTTKKF